MNSRILFSCLIVTVVLVSGCTQNVVCNPPYIRFRDGCCLDEDANNICDEDEAASTTQPSTVAETTIRETTSVEVAAGETTLAASTSVAEAAATTSTTMASTTTSTLAPASTTSLPLREIVFKKDGSYRLTMTFVGLDGAKHTAHLDGGPFEVGDEFMLDGSVYRYVDYEIDEVNNLIVYLKDVGSFKRQAHTLAPKTGEPITLTTYSFIEAARNDREIELDPDEFSLDTSVYSGTILGVPVLAEDETLYFGVDGGRKTVVGVNEDVAGPSKFEGIQLSYWGVGVSVVSENGVNINGARGDVTDEDKDDVFVVVHDHGASGGKRIYIDFYDRNWYRREYTNSVKVASTISTPSSIGKTFFNLDTPEETLIENFPIIAYKYNVTYENGNEITQVRVHT